MSGALLPVSCLGLVVNLIGLFFFHDAVESHEHGPKESSDTMQGMFLHVLADSLASLGVIVSTLLIKHYQLYIADAVCSIVIASMILTSGIPFLKLTGRQLAMEIRKGDPVFEDVKLM